MGRTPPRLAFPASLVRSAAGMVEDLASLVRSPAPMPRVTVDTSLEDVAVSSQRLQTQLGFVPRCALEAGWRATILAMRQRGAL